MGWELKITGAVVVDGTGAPARRADIAIEGGRIVEVGRCDGQAARVIDADGLMVTPGFVDLHTHYDGQISWDEVLAPSCFHGATTVVMGSCGVGFAPCRESDRDRLIALMEGVEDIPGTALAEGLTWAWESFPQYLDALAARPHTLDFAAQVPHDALRVFVMGDRAIAQEQATDQDIAHMRMLLREALEAGAIGFSTGRTDNHRAADGSPTPASEAAARELCGIASAFAGLDHGVLQAVSDFDMAESPERFDPEFDVLEQMATAAAGHPLSISLMQRDQAPQQWQRILERASRAHAHGLNLRVQVAARGIGVLLGLEATFHPFMGFPSYKQISRLPLAERVAAMRDPAFRERILSERSEPVSGDGSSIPPLADVLLANLQMVAMRLFRLGDDFDYEPPLQASLGAEAMRTGRPVLEVLYDALLEDDGRELLYFPIYNYGGHDLEAVRTMLEHPLALPGLSDGGAHVGTICDASFSTYMLSHWTRDRTRGPRLPLERVVRMMTHDTARFLGLRDRGTIEPGMRADLNILDYANLGLERPRLVTDLPAGGRRLLQNARGYRATLVAGVPIVEYGELTGARPGKLVRAGQR